MVEPLPDLVDVAVIGAGAAGLFAATFAARRGRRVVVLEHNPSPGRKILLSGGGRCNFTNLHADASHYHSENPDFARSALSRYTPADFLALVERHRIPWHEKRDGQLFADRSAREIVKLLVDECLTAGARIVTDCRILEVERDDGFSLTTSLGRLRSEALVVATGGLSIPKVGATDFGYWIAGRFGHRVVPCRPALVALRFEEAERARFGDLAGIATEAAVTAGGRTFREGILFTHRGLSGPAVLDASLAWRPGAPVTVDFLPDVDLLAELRRRKAAGGRATARAVLAEHLPDRLAQRLAGAETRLAELRREEFALLSDAVHRFTFVPVETEGYGTAEVTAGGVDTREVSGATMESRLVPGLHFIGEVLDVTGELGGFNFQWAWASGHAAGESV
jgi:predicted Rossmann fold flavoprotein